jgi:hypothetical protein
MAAKEAQTAFQEVTSIGSFRQRPDASHPYSSEMRVRCCWGKVVMFFLFRVGFMIGLGAVQETEPLFFNDCWPRRALTTSNLLGVVTAPYQLSIPASVVQYQTVTTPSLWSSEWEMLTTRSGPVSVANWAASANSFSHVAKVPRNSR